MKRRAWWVDLVMIRVGACDLAWVMGRADVDFESGAACGTSLGCAGGWN